MGGLGREGGGARVSDFFYTESKSKEEKNGGRGTGWGWIDGRKDEQVQTDCPFH